MKTTIEVQTGEVRLGTADSILRSEGIGSCVVIAAYDSKKKTGAMAHVMLPETSTISDDAMPKTRYAFDAIQALLAAMGGAGSALADIEVCLAGGANVLERDNDTIWKANVDSVKKILNEKALRIAAESLGGTKRRSVSLDIGTGTVACAKGDEKEKVLWKAGDNKNGLSRHEEGGTGENTPLEVSREAVNMEQADDDKKRIEELESSQRAYLNIMQDLENKRKETEEVQKAYLNIMEDMEKKNKALDEARTYMNNVMESMTEMLMVLDIGGIFQRVNKAVEKELGYPEKELVGKKVDMITGESAFLNNMTDEGVIAQVDKVFTAKDGRKIPVVFSGSVMIDSQHNNLGIVCVARNITDRKKMEEEIKSQLKETTVSLIQAEKLSAIGEIAAGMCHELNQPLNAMKIISQSAQREITKKRYVEETMVQDFKDIVEQINKAADIINHMRTYSRRTTEQELWAISLNAVVDSAMKFAETQLKNHNIKLVKNLAPDLPMIKGDGIRLEQVLLNLVTNARLALKASDRTEKIIEIKTYPIGTGDNASVALDVKDNGPGVPDNIKEKIFTPFFTTRKQGEGTGLGLSIATKIMSSHKGKLELESVFGQGATFRMVLPVAPLQTEVGR